MSDDDVKARFLEIARHFHDIAHQAMLDERAWEMIEASWRERFASLLAPVLTDAYLAGRRDMAAERDALRGGE